MKKNLSLLAILAMSLVFLPGCEVIGDIFKAGMWVGVIIVVLIVGLVLWLLRKIRK